jgi:hypothetical protein
MPSTSEAAVAIRASFFIRGFLLNRSHLTQRAEQEFVRTEEEFVGSSKRASITPCSFADTFS